MKRTFCIPGLRIGLYRCSDYDAVFGCQSTSLFAAHTTDESVGLTITHRELNQAEGIKKPVNKVFKPFRNYRLIKLTTRLSTQLFQLPNVRCLVFY